jgi:hypothetical protein
MAITSFPAYDVLFTRPTSFFDVNSKNWELRNLNTDLAATRILALDASGYVVETTVAAVDNNFYDNDGILTSDRIVDGDSTYDLDFIGLVDFSLSTDASITLTATTDLTLSAAQIDMPSLPVYADNAGATGGGLVAGDVYQTVTGELRITV